MQVEVFAGRSVEDVGPAVRALQALEGVPISVRPGVTRLQARYLLGVPPGQGEPLQPLQDFLSAHARPDDGVVHLVVLDRLVDPRSALANALQLQGLGIEARAAHSPEAAALIEGLGKDFAPVLLVDVHAVDERLLWHELGHARGLGHDPESGNLMHPLAGKSLREEQRAQLAR